MAESVEFRLLGPVEAGQDGRRVELGQPRQRSVAAVLLTEANRVISASTLIERAWGERAPGSARSALYSYLTRIKAILGLLDPDGERVRLIRASGGYLLETDPDTVDLHRFDRLVERARASDDGDRAAATWAAALELWRGEPYQELSSRWLDHMRDTLSQRRLAAVWARNDVELARGRHAELLAELGDWCDRQPFDERLAAQLMLAKYRCGRQTEALDHFHTMRRRLAEEFGADPGAQLSTLYEQILRNEPGVAAPIRNGNGHGGRVPPVPAQLPKDVRGFTGRTDELRMLDALLAAAAEQPTAVVISAVAGTAGVGKTALAVHWAHTVRDRFADGQLYLDMRGYAPDQPLPPLEALARLLHAFGVPAERVPGDLEAAAAMYRSALADKRMLLVLDNAASTEQVRPLLPGGGGSMVVVTSRDQLDRLVAYDGGHLLNLDVLPPREAQALLTRILGARPDDTGHDTIAELAELCGRLPLALRIAAANLVIRPHQSVAAYVARLRAADRLTALAVAGGPHSAVSVSFDLSYQRLPEPARRMFRLMGLAPGPDVTAEAAAALAGRDVATAGRLLDELARAHLVEEHTLGRYTCHALLRHYAADLAARDETPAARAAARTRLYAYYRDTAEAAARVLYPARLLLRPPPLPVATTDRRQQDQALAWLDAELPCLVATVTHGDRETAWLIADSLRGYFWLRHDVSDWLAVGEAALAAAHAEGDRDAEAMAWLSLGDVHQLRGNIEQALTGYQRARRLSQGGREYPIHFVATNNTGELYLRLGRLRDAAECYERVLDSYRRIGSRTGEALVLGNLGAVHRAMGRLRRAAGLYRQAVSRHRELGDQDVLPTVLQELGELHHLLGEFDRAHTVLTEALALHRRAGDRAGEAETQRCLAAIHRDRGRPALDLATAALALARDTSDVNVETNVLNCLATIHHRLGRHEKAVGHHEQALHAASDAGLRYPQAEALLGLVAACQRLGDHRRARDLLHQATTITEDAGFRVLHANALTARAGLHLTDDDTDDATEVGGQALDLHRDTGHRHGEARTHLLLGHIHQRTGDLCAAHGDWARAHAVFTDIGAAEADHVAALLTK